MKLKGQYYAYEHWERSSFTVWPARDAVHPKRNSREIVFSYFLLCRLGVKYNHR